MSIDTASFSQLVIFFLPALFCQLHFLIIFLDSFSQEVEIFVCVRRKFSTRRKFDSGWINKCNRKSDFRRMLNGHANIRHVYWALDLLCISCCREIFRIAQIFENGHEKRAIFSTLKAIFVRCKNSISDLKISIDRRK